MSEKLSQAMKKRHAFARKQKELFEKTYPDEKKPKYFEFMKQESPLKEKIVAYEVSYQLSYRGQQDSVLIAPRTFTVYGLQGQESRIQNNTMNMVLDSKGAITNSHLNAPMINAMENSMDIKVYPRGMEESQKKPSPETLRKISENGMYTENLDDSITFTNKKGRQGNLKLDVRHFM